MQQEFGSSSTNIGGNQGRSQQPNWAGDQTGPFIKLAEACLVSEDKFVQIRRRYDDEDDNSGDEITCTYALKILSF